jgi:dUTPase
MRGLGAETRAARIPPEVMQLIVTAAKIHLANQAAIRGRSGIEIDHAHTVVMSIFAVVEQGYISKLFWRSLHSRLG